MKETVNFKADGMTCHSCEKIIKQQALKTKGVIDCSISYATQKGSITFDSKKTDIDKVLDAIESKGYECCIIQGEEQKGFVSSKLVGTFSLILSILIIGYFFIRFSDTIQLPEISANMGYGLIFVTGLLTGFHCVGMCGGFVISYTAKDASEGRSSKASHFMYGLGKVISYTVIGALFGFLGSIITFTPFMRGAAGIIAGLFLLLYGLQMLNLFPILRRIRFTTPAFLARFVGKESSRQKSPLIIGLLNGLMLACGPLQAMYVMAAGTGSAIEGAKMLFLFGAGTLPVMLGFGFITGFLSKAAAHKILKASGVIVIIMGFAMLNNGLALTGTGLDINSLIASSSLSPLTGDITADMSVVISGGYQEIRMNVTRYGWEPDKFVLKKGVPVKWIINGIEINGCNNAIQVPAYNLNFKIKKGEQVIEFTPTESGTISWSCWMGMIPGVFIVTDDVNNVNINDVSIPAAAGSCGGAGGGCGCGG